MQENLSSPLLLEGHSLKQVEMFKYLGVLSLVSFGVNMFNQSAVRLGRYLAFSTEDSTTMLQVVLYFNSTSPLTVRPPSIMPQPSGPLT